MSVSDAQIIALLQAGKKQGMNTLFERYYKPLVLFANTLLHDLPEAEDIVLEQFVFTEQLDLPHYSIAEEESNQLDETAIETVLTAVRKLPEKTQRVVQLVMCQGCTYQETANKLDVSINTVKTLLKAGMKELRSELKGYKKIFLLFMLFPRKFQQNSF